MRAQVPRGDGVHHNNPEDSLPFLCFAAAQKLPKKQDLVSKKKGSFVNSTETPLHVRSRPASPTHSKVKNLMKEKPRPDLFHLQPQK